MNYGTTIYIYGVSRLPLKYSDEKLNELISGYIETNNEFS